MSAGIEGQHGLFQTLGQGHQQVAVGHEAVDHEVVEPQMPAAVGEDGGRALGPQLRAAMLGRQTLELDVAVAIDGRAPQLVHAVGKRERVDARVLAMRQQREPQVQLLLRGEVEQLAVANVDRPARPQQVPRASATLVQRAAQLLVQRRGVGLEAQRQLGALRKRF